MAALWFWFMKITNNAKWFPECQIGCRPAQWHRKHQSYQCVHKSARRNTKRQRNIQQHQKLPCTSMSLLMFSCHDVVHKQSPQNFTMAWQMQHTLTSLLQNDGPASPRRTCFPGRCCRNAECWGSTQTGHEYPWKFFYQPVWRNEENPHVFLITLCWSHALQKSGASLHTE